MREYLTTGSFPQRNSEQPPVSYAEANKQFSSNSIPGANQMPNFNQFNAPAPNPQSTATPPWATQSPSTGSRYY